MADVKKELKLIIAIAAVGVIFAAGFGIRFMFLNREINRLNDTLAQRTEIMNSMQSVAGLTDSQFEADKKFLDEMFGDIFTFHNETEFDGAKQNAETYALPSNFVNPFYDKTELTDNIYGDAMLDILCEYSSSDLYLLDRQDNIGYYYAVVTLDTVKYNSDFKLGLFISLADSGDIYERVGSLVCYSID